MDTTEPGSLAGDVHVPGTYPGLVGLAASVVTSAYIYIGMLMFLIVLAGATFGLRPAVVTSGSMSPALSPGDVVLHRAHDGRGLNAGDVIVYDNGTGQVTHRIVDVNGDGAYVTRGDAARRSDTAPVTYSNVVGQVRVAIPYMGLPAHWWHARNLTPLSVWTVGTVLALSVALPAIVAPWRRPDDEDLAERKPSPASGRPPPPPV